MFRKAFQPIRQIHTARQIDWETHFFSALRSGGQTGVDRGVHRSARHLGIEICGWVPKGKLARDPIPEEYFPMLKEMTDAEFPQLVGVTDKLERYLIRTEQNAKEGHGTLVIVKSMSEYCGGTLYTAQMAKKHNKPCYVFNFSESPSVDELVKWIKSNLIYELNVGGPNEEKSPGIDQAAYDLMSEVILHPELNNQLRRMMGRYK